MPISTIGCLVLWMSHFHVTLGPSSFQWWSRGQVAAGFNVTCLYCDVWICCQIRSAKQMLHDTNYHLTWSTQLKRYRKHKETCSKTQKTRNSSSVLLCQCPSGRRCSFEFIHACGTDAFWIFDPLYNAIPKMIATVWMNHCHSPCPQHYFQTNLCRSLDHPAGMPQWSQTGVCFPQPLRPRSVPRCYPGIWSPGPQQRNVFVTPGCQQRIPMMWSYLWKHWAICCYWIAGSIYFRRVVTSCEII